MRKFIELFMTRSVFLYSLAVIICFLFFPAQSGPNAGTVVLNIPSFEQKQNAWVEEVLAGMGLEEKVGQLFTIAVYSNKNEAEYRIVENQISKYHLGGVAFFQGNAIKQAELTNRYQEAATIPLLVGLDAEWGLGMRLNNTVSFPKAITVGATKDPLLAEQIGYEIAKQCKRIGVHINFAPVADINSNPLNPVINYRSFGESPKTVSDLAVAFAKGHRKAGVMASAKHFPGHGDTQVDSHYDLPVIRKSLKEIETIEAAPFKAMIADSVASVMVGHLEIPALDNGVPASVSPKIIKDYLQNTLGFKGLVITDALNMSGLLRDYPVGKAEVAAVKAGTDVLLQTANIALAYSAVLQACQNGEITEAELDRSVRKILAAKYWAGLSEYKPVDLRNIQQDINNEQSYKLRQQVFNKAMTISSDDFGYIPVKGLNKVSSLAVGADAGNSFQDIMQTYADVNPILLENKPANSSHWKTAVDEATKSDLVIVSLHKIRQSEKIDYGITDETLNMLREIKKRSKLILCVFGNPYSLKFFDEFESVICGYEDEEEAYLAMANVLFGVNPANGKIPVNTLSENAKLNVGIHLKSYNNLGFALPSELNVNTKKLQQIESIVKRAILDQEFPGCQVLAAYKGKVIYYEPFGSLTYAAEEAVSRNTIYDLASITKIASTVQAMMMLSDQKKIDINRPISFYLPELRSSDKSQITVKDVLLHQAGLKAFVPFYDFTSGNNSGLNPAYFSAVSPGPDYSLIANNIYASPALKDMVYSWIIETPLSFQPGQRYVYSDLGLLLLQRLIEKVSNRNLDGFVGSNIYEPMGLKNMLYKPLVQKDISQIAPTEVSGDFRKTALRGTVHDPNAALLGGVAGHAGLFSNALDLARLMQMDLNGGKYGDYKFFSKQTVDLFTTEQSNLSQRGLGWNKPPKAEGSVSNYASENTYGHTGFTGTCVWVDPVKELIYVFLSNRVYPSARNKKLIQNNTRQKIHDIFYEAIK